MDIPPAMAATRRLRVPVTIPQEEAAGRAMEIVPAAMDPAPAMVPIAQVTAPAITVVPVPGAIRVRVTTQMLMPKNTTKES